MSRELKLLAQGHGESAEAGSGSKAWSSALHSSLGHLMQSDPWKLPFLPVSLSSFGPFRSWDKFSITENKFGCTLKIPGQSHIWWFTERHRSEIWFFWQLLKLAELIQKKRCLQLCCRSKCYITGHPPVSNCIKSQLKNFIVLKELVQLPELHCN